MIDAHEQVERFQEFFESSYKKEIHEIVSKGLKSLVVDFVGLTEFDHELADLLLEEPEEVIKAAELAVEHFDVKEAVRVRFKNLPKDQQIMIKEIRSKHINKLLYFEAIVRQSSDIRPQVVCAKFECPACGSVITILQLETKFKEPSRCTCGRKGKFRLLSKDLVDAQRLVVEEAPEDLEGGAQPKRMSVFLKEDLVEPKMEKKTTPGNKVGVVGIVKEIPIILKSGVTSTRYDLMIEANYLEPIQEEYTEIDLSPEDEAEIKSLASDPHIYERLINSISPSIWGHDKIKEALILQLIGGVRKVKKDGTITRGDMHVLLVGDPGAGKCASGSTKVTFSDGSIFTIKDFVDKQSSFELEDGGFKSNTPFSVPALGKDGSIGFKSSNVVWKRKSPDTMLKIRTATGNELVVTKNHPLFTTYYGLIFANEAQNFSAGDYIATPRFIKVNASLQSLPTNFERSKSHNKKTLLLPPYLNKDIARLLGYIISEGYIQLSQESGHVTFTNNNEALLDDFCSLVKKLNLNYTLRMVRKGKNSMEGYCSSIELIRFLKLVEPSLLLHSKDKKIPQIICKSPNHVLKEFIKALFDGEGHIMKNRRQIDISSASKDLIYDLKLLLLRFGILSQVSMKMKCATNTADKTRRPYYELRISGKDAVKYILEIGFNHPDKKIKAQELLGFSKVFNTNLDLIPNLANLLKDLRKDCGLRQDDINIPKPSYRHYEKGDRHISSEQLKKIISSYDTDNPLLSVLKKIACADIFWDRIVSIKEVPSESEFVYDIQVDETHNYIANAVIVHNSNLLQFISKAAPKARYVAGRSTSAAGITASVVKDEFLRGWALEAGAMVLANKGILCLHPDSNVVFNRKIVSIKKLYNPQNEKVVLNTKKEKIYFDKIKGKIRSFDFKTKSTKDSVAIKIIRKYYKGMLKKINFNSGGSIKLTPNHKLIDGNSLIWKEARQFKKGEFVVAHNKKSDYSLKQVKNISDEPYEGYVYDLLVPEHHNFVASGIFVHNCLDEMDKMAREDTDALHEAMEQQQVTITKANIQATLRSETSILAAANPKLGRFDPYKLVADQIDLPPALINRFDLIFPMRDLPDKMLDSRIAQHVLEMQQEPDAFKPDIPRETLRKFVSFLKQNVFPKMTQEALEEIKNFYVGLRNSESASDKEGRRKPIPITPRQLEALIRLAEASARVRLDTKIKRQDARRAIELLKYCLMQVGIDPETGQIDIDVLSTGMSTSTKNKMFLVREIIASIEEKRGDKLVPIGEVISVAESKGLDESTVTQIIDKLNREGEIFKPKEGFVKKI